VSALGSGTEVLALIPARGGSKSIPRKNIRLFAGYPLIAYSIAAGRAAESVTRVIVSTDDQEIARLPASTGGVPFLRPAKLADETPDLPVFQHATRQLEENGTPAGIVVLLPTSPFRRTWHIEQAVAPPAGAA
jgi:N-acylneuraminate cytidylyltransferase